MNKVTIIGAGLAGSEAALTLASNGYEVTLYDAKPKHIIPPYNLPFLDELVCNNSLGSINVNTPLGLLIYELSLFSSPTLKIASNHRVDDFNNLALDKKSFSKAVTLELKKRNIKIVNQKIDKLPKDEVVILATGPLTSENLMSDVSQNFGIHKYYFSDASSPVVNIKTVSLQNSLFKKITDDTYVLCIPKHVFSKFYKALLGLSPQPRNMIDKEIDFEKCQSLENLAKQGEGVLYETRFKQEGFNQPCLLLRRESAFEDGFILVGCMTTSTYKEQQKLFSILPGFDNCKFIKFGRMHKNTFINSPEVLNEFYQIKNTNVYIIGQLSGIDGYVPAISSGFVAAKRIIYGDKLPAFPQETMIGGLANYVSNKNITDFQPMCASFALIKGSSDSYKEQSQKAIKKYLYNFNF